jgi:hypothetical protein
MAIKTIDWLWGRIDGVRGFEEEDEKIKANKIDSDPWDQ